MVFTNHPLPSSAPKSPSTTPSALDPLEWYPYFQSCRRFFLDHSQHSPLIQAVAAFTNILLPFQQHPNPVSSSSNPPLTRPTTSSPGGNHNGNGNNNDASSPTISLIPYIRRLIVTGLDTPSLLHSFFGSDWLRGIGPLHDLERRNYLFAAKSASWLDVKTSYEPSPTETVPCMAPLRAPSEAEILAAEAGWSEWLALQDWMVGPRAPGLGEGAGGLQVKIKRDGGE